MRGTINFLFTFFALVCFYGVDANNDDILDKSTDFTIAKNINYLGARMSQSLTLFDQNIVYSPLSISLALGMLISGTSLQTKAQLCSLLNKYCPVGEPIKKPIKELLEHYERIQNALEATNSVIFSDKRYYLPYGIWYYNQLTDNYKAQGRVLDLITNIRQINNNDHTKTQMILMNELNFTAEWKYKMENYIMPFANLNGEQNAIYFLHLNQYYKSFKSEKLQLIELPYKSQRFSLILLLPNKTNDVHYLKKEIIENETKLENLLGELEKSKKTEMDLYLPKFSYHYEFDLKREMEKLNARNVFNKTEADFSPITGCRCADRSENCMYVSKAHHTTFIEVGEKGTKAAAKSIFWGSRQKNVQVKNKTVPISRPFAYVIRDKITGINIFVGYVIKQ